MNNHDYKDQILYHYTSFKGLMGILTTRCIWATLIEDLADENELVYGRDMIARQFELEARQNSGLETELLSCARSTRKVPNISEMIREFGAKPEHEDARFRWYVACFSARRDSLPLWRGFTDKCSRTVSDMILCLSLVL